MDGNNDMQGSQIKKNQKEIVNHEQQLTSIGKGDEAKQQKGQSKKIMQHLKPKSQQEAKSTSSSNRQASSEVQAVMSKGKAAAKPL